MLEICYNILGRIEPKEKEKDNNRNIKEDQRERKVKLQLTTAATVNNSRTRSMTMKVQQEYSTANKEVKEILRKVNLGSLGIGTGGSKTYAIVAMRKIQTLNDECLRKSLDIYWPEVVKNKYL